MLYFFLFALLLCTYFVANKPRITNAYVTSITEGVTIIENKRPDWLLQYYKHCQKLKKVSDYPFSYLANTTKYVAFYYQ